MKDKGCTGMYCILTIANIVGLLAIVITAAVIGTDRWLVYQVDRSKLSTADRVATTSGSKARIYHTRHQGMFRECYPNNDTSFLETAADVVDKNCFLLPLADTISGATTEYRVMNGLYTAFVAVFILAEILLVVSYIAGLVLCAQSKYHMTWTAALLSFLAVFFLALGFALFHGAIHVGKTQVHDSLQGRRLYYSEWPRSLQDATATTFGWSYIGGWVGFVLAVITCGCYIGIVCSIPRRRGRQSKAQEAGQYPQKIMYPQPSPQQPVVYYLTQ